MSWWITDLCPNENISIFNWKLRICLRPITEIITKHVHALKRGLFMLVTSFFFCMSYPYCFSIRFLLSLTRRSFFSLSDKLNLAVNGYIVVEVSSVVLQCVLKFPPCPRVTVLRYSPNQYREIFHSHTTGNGGNFDWLGKVLHRALKTLRKVFMKIF